MKTIKILYGHCHCGCGQKTKIARKSNKKHGWVKGKPIKYIRHHQNRKSPMEYIINSKNDCWEWQRGKTPQGYGKIRWKGKETTAHRYMYEKLIGSIPKGLHIDHLCNNRSCVNPKHLEPVTPRENVWRGKKTKISINNAGTIRDLYSKGLALPSELARLYGVKPPCIHKIVRFKRLIPQV